VNHTALTVEALRRRDLAIAGIVLNRTAREDDPSVPHNAAEIARLTGIVPVAVLPFVPDIAERAAGLRSRLAGKIQF
jgi:dethiobiotin synthetase